MAVIDVTTNPFCTVFPFDYLGQLYSPGLLSLPGPLLGRYTRLDHMTLDTTEL